MLLFDDSNEVYVIERERGQTNIPMDNTGTVGIKTHVNGMTINLMTQWLSETFNFLYDIFVSSSSFNSSMAFFSIWESLFFKYFLF